VRSKQTGSIVGSCLVVVVIVKICSARTRLGKEREEEEEEEEEEAEEAEEEEEEEKEEFFKARSCLRCLFLDLGEFLRV